MLCIVESLRLTEAYTTPALPLSLQAETSEADPFSHSLTPNTAQSNVMSVDSLEGSEPI